MEEHIMCHKTQCCDAKGGVHTLRCKTNRRDETSLECSSCYCMFLIGLSRHRKPSWRNIGIREAKEQWKCSSWNNPFSAATKKPPNQTHLKNGIVFSSFFDIFALIVPVWVCQSSTYLKSSSWWFALVRNEPPPACVDSRMHSLLLFSCEAVIDRRILTHNLMLFVSVFDCRGIKDTEGFFLVLQEDASMAKNLAWLRYGRHSDSDFRFARKECEGFPFV